MRHRVQCIAGNQKLGDHVGVFVMAPFDGVWPSHIAALDCLIDAGVSPLVVSNLPLERKDRNAICDRSAVLIERPNQGYDFGAYREACLYLRDRLGDLKRLTLLNDSTWFPAPGSQNWFAQLAQGEAGFQGAASNYGASTIVPQDLRNEPWAYGPGAADFHLQSYALSFSKEVLNDRCFRQFWQSYSLVNDKDLTVSRGEIGLSKWLQRHGWAAASTYPISRMDALLSELPKDRLREISENVIVLGNPRFAALKARVLDAPADQDRLQQFLLLAARCLGVSYALPDFNMVEMRFPFLKKSPIWHQQEASDITLRLIETRFPDWDIIEEARFLRRKLERS